jgi:hypothetical protein
VRVRSRAGLVLRAGIAGLTLDRRGSPVVAPRGDASSWLTVRPRVVTTGQSGATFLVVAHRPAHARPGDHTAILLVTAFVSGRAGIAVGIRVGVAVTVRIPGRKLRRVVVVAAHGRGRLVSLTVANRGDVIEPVGGASLTVELVRHGRTVARLRGVGRALLPRTRAVLTFRARRRVRGVVVARVTLAQPGSAVQVRRFPLRL